MTRTAWSSSSAARGSGRCSRRSRCMRTRCSRSDRIVEELWPDGSARTPQPRSSRSTCRTCGERAGSGPRADRDARLGVRAAPRGRLDRRRAASSRSRGRRRPTRAALLAALHSTCGAARRSTTWNTSRSPSTRSRGSRSGGSGSWRSGSPRISKYRPSATSSPSSRGLCAPTRCASACADSTCSRSTARGGRRTPSSPRAATGARRGPRPRAGSAPTRARARDPAAGRRAPRRGPGGVGAHGGTPWLC